MGDERAFHESVTTLQAAARNLRTAWLLSDPDSATVDLRYHMEYIPEFSANCPSTNVVCANM